MAEAKEDFWQTEWKKAEKERTKCLFVIGWLSQELKDQGMYASTVDEKLAFAEKEATRIYG